MKSPTTGAGAQQANAAAEGIFNCSIVNIVESSFFSFLRFEIDLIPKFYLQIYVINFVGVGMNGE